jgi:hypothetical protein
MRCGVEKGQVRHWTDAAILSFTTRTRGHFLVLDYDTTVGDFKVYEQCFTGILGYTPEYLSYYSYEVKDGEGQI